MGFLFHSLLLTAALAAPTPLDFWESNPATWAKLRDQRKIVVSAKNEDGRTVSRGAGLVNADVAEVWAFVLDTEKVRSTSRFLKSFTWNKSTGDVDMLIEILVVSYRLKGRAVPKPDPENPRIEFQVFEGDLVPFTAELELRSATAQRARPGATDFPEGKTLVRLEGRSAKDRALSWPLQVAMEAVLQRTAGHLREAVEGDVALKRGFRASDARPNATSEPSK